MKLPTKQHVTPNDVVTIILPWSEVCMHMGVAGTTMQVRVLERGAQLLQPDGRNHSFPILHGEAGIYRDDQGLYVVG